MQPDSNAAPATIPFENPAAPQKPNRRGRPRTLDDARRREICAFVSTGLSVREAARCVKCGFNTIQREAQRNPEFQEQLRRAEVNAKLGPLHAMQKAAYTHWRAGAWFLERMFPERFGRGEQAGLGARQAKKLMNEIIGVIYSEVADGARRGRMEKRVQAMFEYYVRVACDGKRTGSGLREALKFFDEKNKVHDPLAFLGIVQPDLDALFDAYPPPGAQYTAPSPTPPAAQPQSPSPSSTTPPKAPSSPPSPPKPQPPRSSIPHPQPQSTSQPAPSWPAPSKSPLRKRPFNGLKPSMVQMLAGGLSEAIERHTNTPAPSKPKPSGQQPLPEIQSLQSQTPAPSSLRDQPPPPKPS